MTKINIGTDHGNLVGIEVDKPFDEISQSDVRKIINEHFTYEGKVVPVHIYGWADVTPIEVESNPEIKLLAGLLEYAIDNGRISGNYDLRVEISSVRDSYKKIAEDYLKSIK